MAGMGATLSPAGFACKLRVPRAVLAGMLLQLLAMSLPGWSIALSFGVPPRSRHGSF